MKKQMPSGGKREGAGRKIREEKTRIVSFRVDLTPYQAAKEIHGRGLNQKVNDFIKRLSKKK